MLPLKFKFYGGPYMKILTSTMQSISQREALPTCNQPSAPRSDFFVSSSIKLADEEGKPSFLSKMWGYVSAPFTATYNWLAWFFCCCPSEDTGIEAFKLLMRDSEEFDDLYNENQVGVVRDLARSFLKDPKTCFDMLLKNPDKCQLLLGKLKGVCTDEFMTILDDYRKIDSPEVAKLLISTLRKFAADMSGKLKKAKATEDAEEDLANLRTYFETTLPKQCDDWEKEPATLIPFWRDLRDQLPAEQTIYAPMMRQLERMATEDTGKSLNRLVWATSDILTSAGDFSEKEFNTKLFSGVLKTLGPKLCQELLAKTGSDDKYRMAILEEFQSLVEDADDCGRLAKVIPGLSNLYQKALAAAASGK